MIFAKILEMPHCIRKSRYITCAVYVNSSVKYINKLWKNFSFGNGSFLVYWILQVTYNYTERYTGKIDFKITMKWPVSLVAHTQKKAEWLNGIVIKKIIAPVTIYSIYKHHMYLTIFKTLVSTDWLIIVYFYFGLFRKKGHQWEIKIQETRWST